MTQQEQHKTIVEVCWHWTYVLDQHLKTVQRAISEGSDDRQTITLLLDAANNLEIACGWLPKPSTGKTWEDHDL